MELILKHTCGNCNGTGEIGDPPIQCGSCGGTGELYWGHADTIMAEFNEVDAKLDSIIAEQASQRADLTAALTQIWNKVKDL